MKFSARLKRLRKIRGITQTELGDQVGITLKQIQRYERGENEPTMSVLTALADCFRVSIDYLTGRSDCYFRLTEGTVQGCKVYGITMLDYEVCEHIIEDIATSKDFVQNLVKLMTENEVSKVHFLTVIQDALELYYIND